MQTTPAPPPIKPICFKLSHYPLLWKLAKWKGLCPHQLPTPPELPLPYFYKDQYQQHEIYLQQLEKEYQSQKQQRPQVKPPRIQHQHEHQGHSHQFQSQPNKIAQNENLEFELKPQNQQQQFGNQAFEQLPDNQQQAQVFEQADEKVSTKIDFNFGWHEENWLD